MNDQFTFSGVIDSGDAIYRASCSIEAKDDLIITRDALKHCFIGLLKAFEFVVPEDFLDDVWTKPNE